MRSYRSEGNIGLAMEQRSLLKASVTTLGLLIVWWVGIHYLDGVLAMTLPYDQYEMVAFLYPEVYYPGLPGWVLAHAQPFAVGVWLVSIGWMVVLSFAIGGGATQFASETTRSPPNVAAATVIALFVLVTVIEAATTLLF